MFEFDETLFIRPEGQGWKIWYAWHPVIVRHWIPMRWLVPVWRRPIKGSDFECVPAKDALLTDENRDRMYW